MWCYHGSVMKQCSVCHVSVCCAMVHTMVNSVLDVDFAAVILSSKHM